MNEKKKCGQCGLVNWPGLMECARCGAFLSNRGPDAPIGRNPYEGTESKGPNDHLIGAALVFTLIGGMIAFYALSPATPKTADGTPKQLTPEAVPMPSVQGFDWREGAVNMDDKSFAERMKNINQSIADCPTRYLEENPGGGQTCTFVRATQ